MNMTEDDAEHMSTRKNREAINRFSEMPAKPR